MLMSRPPRRHPILSVWLMVMALLAGSVAVATAATAANPGGPHVPPGQGDPNRSAMLSYEDVQSELRSIEARSKGAVQVEEVGLSGEGRSLTAAFIGSGDTRVWIQGRIHGNEPYGAEASLAFLKFLASGSKHARDMLDEITFVIIPLYNPDGYEAYIRQDTVHRIDLNRDWAWATQPETRARLATWNRWSPQVHVDFHEMSYTSTYFFFPATPPINPLYPRHILDWGQYFGSALAIDGDRFLVTAFNGRPVGL
jgi:predicted deacylase